MLLLYLHFFTRNLCIYGEMGLTRLRIRTLPPTCIVSSESWLLPAEPSSPLHSQHLDSCCCLGSPYVLSIALASYVLCLTRSSFPPHPPLSSSASSVSHLLMEEHLFLPFCTHSKTRTRSSSISLLAQIG